MHSITTHEQRKVVSTAPPPGFIDEKDGSDNIILGTWRVDGSSGGLQPVGLDTVETGTSKTCNILYATYKY